MSLIGPCDAECQELFFNDVTQDQIGAQHMTSSG